MLIVYLFPYVIEKDWRLLIINHKGSVICVSWNKGEKYINTYL